MNFSSLLITGGCGFIGTSLIAHILQKAPDTRIRVLDNLSVGAREDLAKVANFRETTPEQASSEDGVCLVNADILDQEAVLACAKGADGIVHLAAQTGVGPSVEDPRHDLEQNVVGTFNLLEAARRQGVPRFVFASSGAPAGGVEPPIHEDLPARPISPYGASKLAGEAYCSVYANTYGVGAASLRFGNVYGPRSTHKASVVAKFIKLILAGEPCEIYGDGTQTRDFIYIDDLLDAVLLCLERDIKGEVFQIAAGEERTVAEVAELIKDTFQRLAGLDAVILHGPVRAGDVKRNFSDTSQARRMLGWEPRTPRNAGIEKTIRFFLDS